MKYLDKKDWYLYSRGTEENKGSEILLTKEFLTALMKAILFNDATKEDIILLITKYRDKVLKKEITNVDKLTIIKRIGKLPSEYRNFPVHVALAVKRKEKGDLFFVGKRVPYIVVANKPLRIVHQDEFDGSYDEKYYWENQIFPPAFRLLETVFPDYNWDKYLSGEVGLQNDLGDYS